MPDPITEPNPPNPPAPVVPEPEPTVDKAAFQRLQNDLFKEREEKRKANEELKKIKDEDLKKNNDYKAFAESKEKEATEYKDKYERLNSSIDDQAKMNAVKTAAIKLGLVDGALDDLDTIDFKDVIVERTSTGKLNVIGANSAADRLKVQKPHWFGNKPPNINPNAPTVINAGGKVTEKELQELEKEAVKTGDYKAYQAKILEFKKQG